MKSYSELSTYLECQKKWDLVYKQGHKETNVHFTFGEMAHKVMETKQIPEEDLYPELKEFFGIKSWKNYFNAIFEDLDKRLSEYNLIHTELKLNNGILVGLIDAVWQHKTTGRYLITDYKFSTKEKDINDIVNSEQLYIYAFLFANYAHIKLEDIDISYISIPKTELDEPRILLKGGLSKDKSQNVTYDCYLNKIRELGLDEKDYEDVLSDLSGKTLLGMNITTVNYEVLIKILQNIELVIKDMEKGYILEKFHNQCNYCNCKEFCKKDK